MRKILKGSIALSLLACNVYASPVQIVTNPNAIDTIDTKIVAHENLKYDSIDLELLDGETIKYLDTLEFDKSLLWNKYNIDPNNKKVSLKGTLNNMRIDNTGASINFDIGDYYKVNEGSTIDWEYYFSGLGECKEFKWIVNDGTNSVEYLNQNPPNTLQKGKYIVTLEYKDESDSLFSKTKVIEVGSSGGGSNIVDTYGNSKVLDVAVDSDTLITLNSDGTLRGASSNNYGNLGIGNKTRIKVPSYLKDIDIPNIAHVYAEDGFTVLQDTSNNLYSAGYNGNGELGTGYESERLTFKKIDGIPTNIREVQVTSHDNTYVITEDGDLYFFGRNDYYQAGDGGRVNKYNPIKIDFFDKNIADFHSGGTHCVALTTDGKVYTWGNDSARQTGFNEGTYVTEPRLVENVENVKEVYATLNSTILLKEDGNLYVTGNRHYTGINQGDGYVSYFTEYDTGLDIDRMFVGENGIFVIDTEGRVYATGRDTYYSSLGVPGTGTVYAFTEITALSGLDIVEIAPAERLTAVLTSDGVVRVMGQTSMFSNIDSNNTHEPIPLKVLNEDIIGR